MKKTIFTLLLCGLAYVGFGQLKVISSGFVGLNQANPSQRLHITDLPANSPGFAVEATGVNFVKAAAGTTASAFFYKNNKFFTIVPAASLATVGANQLNSFAVVGASANVGIGTWAPTEKLDVVGNIKASGTITPSDRRLKGNINEFAGGLSEVLELNPVSFEYNGKGGTMQGSEHIGLIAQDFQKVVPSMVKEFKHVTYKEGSIGEELKTRSSENYLEIKDSEIKYLLINAIKEQQAIIDKQEERIAALEEAMVNGVGFQEIDLSKSDLNGLANSSEERTQLKQNRPNPFSDQTVIDYFVPATASSAVLNIYNIDGQLFKTIDIDQTGQGQVQLNVENLPAGTYSYQLLVDGKNEGNKKMILQN